MKDRGLNDHLPLWCLPTFLTTEGLSLVLPTKINFDTSMMKLGGKSSSAITKGRKLTPKLYISRVFQYEIVRNWYED